MAAVSQDLKIAHSGVHSGTLRGVQSFCARQDMEVESMRQCNSLS